MHKNEKKTLKSFSVFARIKKFQKGNILHIKNALLGLEPVGHACNPSYSGGRNQGDQGLKVAQASS
jgi:hypothetical protein